MESIFPDRNSYRICVLEDEQSMRNLLKRLLSSHYTVYFANSGAELSAEIEKNNVDLVLLDIHLPGEDGLTIAKFIRVRSPIPIILISGLSSPGIITQGLNIGGDDYVTKPFDPDVLLARIRNALKRSDRRNRDSDGDIPSTLMFLDCKIDLWLRTVTNHHGDVVSLTERELHVLAALIHADGAILSRDNLCRVLTGQDITPTNRALDVHISHIRKKLRSLTSISQIIVNHRSKGYSILKSDNQIKGSSMNPPQLSQRPKVH